jgi:hypothetical protein
MRPVPDETTQTLFKVIDPVAIVQFIDGANPSLRARRPFKSWFPSLTRRAFNSLRARPTLWAFRPFETRRPLTHIDEGYLSP